MERWAKAIQKVKPYMYRIHTPKGYGTGFQLYHPEESIWCGIATALHVVSHALEWDEPVKIYHYASKKIITLKFSDRITCQNPEFDLAAILFNKNKLRVNPGTLQLISVGKRLNQGVQAGWCGFPELALNDLCFFEGHISSYLEKQQSYLVDGVAIKGVSGGPAFYFESSEDDPLICGVVTAYIPSMVSGQVLPGVCFIRSVQAFQALLDNIESVIKKLKKPTKKT